MSGQQKDKRQQQGALKRMSRTASRASSNAGALFKLRYNLYFVLYSQYFGSARCRLVEGQSGVQCERDSNAEPESNARRATLPITQQVDHSADARQSLAAQAESFALLLQQMAVTFTSDL